MIPTEGLTDDNSGKTFCFLMFSVGSKGNIWKKGIKVEWEHNSKVSVAS